jgi:hypothetical protein
VIIGRSSGSIGQCQCTTQRRYKKINVTGNHVQFQRLFIAPKTHYTMERIREEDRSQLIKVSMVLFSVLAVLSFTLAKVPW